MAGGEDDGHLAGRGVDRAEEQDGFAGRLFADAARCQGIAEVLQADTAAAAPVAGLALAVLLGDGDADELDHGPGVVDEEALGVGDAHVLEAVRVMGLDLGDALIERLGRGVGFADEGHLGAEGGLMGGAPDDVAARRPGPVAEGRGRSAGGLAAGDSRGRLGGFEDLVEGEVVRIAETRPVAADDADAQADAHGFGRLLDDVLLHVDEVVGPVLHEDLGEVAAARKGHSKGRAEVCRREAEVVDVGERTVPLRGLRKFLVVHGGAMMA